MPDLPNSLALTTIADDAEIIASDHRNNYSSIQTGTNGLITALSGGTSGQFLRATDTDTVTYAYPPAYEFAYDEFTSAVGSITGTNIAGATTVKTSTSYTFDGSTAVWLEFFTPYLIESSANFRVKFELFEDSTDIGEFGGAIGSASAGATVAGVTLRRRRTPAAGAHTYTVKAFVPDGGTGTVGAGAGGSAGTPVPGFIRITKA